MKRRILVTASETGLVTIRDLSKRNRSGGGFDSFVFFDIEGPCPDIPPHGVGESDLLKWMSECELNGTVFHRV
jgi:hypothetical protein